MAVYDRWHLSFPQPGDEPCEHKRGKTQLYGAKAHGKGKRYQVRWRDEAGEPQKRNFDKKTGNDPETCADAFDAKVHADLNAGTYIDPAAGKTTLETRARAWRKGLTSDPRTQANVDHRLAHIYDGLGQYSMAALARTPSVIQQWIVGLQTKGNGLSPGTIKGIVGTLSTVFEAAVIDGTVSRNPIKTRAVAPPPVVKRKVVPWTLEQLDRAARALPESDRALAYLGAGCGMRQGELFGIAVDAVDFLGRQVHVRLQVRYLAKTLVFSLPKGDKERTVPLPESVGLRLAAHIEAHPPVEVTLPWHEPGGKPFTAKLLFTRPGARAHYFRSFNKTWAGKVRPAAGVPETREHMMHVLRHTAASAWLAAGVDVRTVAEYLGHADPGFTLRTYAHLMPDAADRARSAMDAFFGGGQGEIVKRSALIVPSGPGGSVLRLVRASR